MTLTAAELRQLGYEVKDGKAVRVGSVRVGSGDAGTGGRSDAAQRPEVAAVPSNPSTRYRSKWEAERAVILEARKRAGLIRDWQHEAIRLRVADGAWYKPDFLVTHNDGRVQVEEVKGHWREAARVRWKVIRERFPMLSPVALTKRNGLWLELD